MEKPLLPAERQPFFYKLLFVTFVIVLPFALGSSPAIFDDGDVSWHIAAGQWMFANGRIPATDPFSFTMAGSPWVAHEWLAEIIYAAAFDAAGYAGLAAVVSLAILLTFLVIFWQLHSQAGPVALLLAFAALAIVLTPFELARPHILVWPLLALWTAVLLRHRDSGRAPPLVLALLMLVWANLHGSYPLGLVIAGAIALDAMIAGGWDRRLLGKWLLFGAASLAAALVNANGVAGIIHPFTILGMDTAATIAEWRPSTPARTPWFYVVLVATIGTLLARGVRLRLGALLLLLAMLMLAFSQVRHQSWLAIVAVLILTPALAHPEKEVRLFKTGRSRRAGLLIAAAAILALLLIRAMIPIQPLENRSNPRTLIANIPEGLKAEPVLNEYTFGGPLILAGIRPFIDGRADMYGDDFVRDYAAIVDGDTERFQAAVSKYGIRWTMLPPTNSLARRLDTMVGWRRIYADRTGVIHVRRDGDGLTAASR